MSLSDAARDDLVMRMAVHESANGAMPNLEDVRAGMERRGFFHVEDGSGDVLYTDETNEATYRALGKGEGLLAEMTPIDRLCLCLCMYPAREPRPLLVALDPEEADLN